MKLKTALELGIESGLNNVGDCVYEIKRLVPQLFSEEEYRELIEDCRKFGINGKEDAVAWLEEHNNE